MFAVLCPDKLSYVHDSAMPCLALLCHTLFGSTLLYIAAYSLPCPALPCPALPCPAWSVRHGSMLHAMAIGLFESKEPPVINATQSSELTHPLCCSGKHGSGQHCTSLAPHIPCKAFKAYCDMPFTAAMGLACCESEHTLLHPQQLMHAVTHPSMNTCLKRCDVSCVICCNGECRLRRCRASWMGWQPP